MCLEQSWGLTSEPRPECSGSKLNLCKSDLNIQAEAEVSAPHIPYLSDGYSVNDFHPFNLPVQHTSNVSNLSISVDEFPWIIKYCENAVA